MAAVATALLAAHIICVTLGYSALVISNIWLAIGTRTGDRGSIHATLRSSLTISRTFGPLLGVGVLLGFAVMGTMGIPAFSGWLIFSYVVIVLAAALQGVIAIPWHFRALRAIREHDETAALDTRTPAYLAGGFVVAFVLIVGLMVSRPYAF